MKRPTVPGPEQRVLVRSNGTMTLRVETAEGFRSGSQLPSFATVEWAGRIGHPSSYALLGGTRSDTAGVSVHASGASFKEALAAPTDDVRWGLPSEYEEAIVSLLADQSQRVLVSRAAYGVVGSSERAFRAVALPLSQILASGLPSAEDAVWKLRDHCWNTAR
jgi:hypothetical protein